MKVVHCCDRALEVLACSLRHPEVFEVLLFCETLYPQHMRNSHLTSALLKRWTFALHCQIYFPKGLSCKIDMLLLLHRCDVVWCIWLHARHFRAEILSHRCQICYQSEKSAFNSFNVGLEQHIPKLYKTLMYGNNVRSSVLTGAGKHETLAQSVHIYSPEKRSNQATYGQPLCEWTIKGL